VPVEPQRPTRPDRRHGERRGGALRLRVTTLGADSALAKIVRLASTARRRGKLPIQALSFDRVAGVLCAVVC